jgi:hypothetical protein
MRLLVDAHVVCFYALLVLGGGCRDPHVLTSYRASAGIEGTARRGPHTGVDFDGESGDDVLAATDGVVTNVVESQGAGNCVLLRHSGHMPHVHMTLCTFPCASGTSDGTLEGTLDPMQFDVGCFAVDRTYQASKRLVLTHPVACSGR